MARMSGIGREILEFLRIYQGDWHSSSAVAKAIVKSDEEAQDELYSLTAGGYTFERGTPGSLEYRISARGVDLIKKKVPLGHIIGLLGVIAAVLSILLGWLQFSWSKQQYIAEHYPLLDLDCRVETYPNVWHEATYTQMPSITILKKIVEYYKYKMPWFETGKQRYTCVLTNSGTAAAKDLELAFRLHFLKKKEPTAEIGCQREYIPAMVAVTSTCDPVKFKCAIP